MTAGTTPLRRGLADGRGAAGEGVAEGGAAVEVGIGGVRMPGAIGARSPDAPEPSSELISSDTWVKFRILARPASRPEPEPPALGRISPARVGGYSIWGIAG
jgi:hypothetical protein